MGSAKATAKVASGVVAEVADFALAATIGCLLKSCCALPDLCTPRPDYYDCEE
jgi:hypothetical protein